MMVFYRRFKREDKRNFPDIHRAVEICRISRAALTYSLITVRDKTTSSKPQKQKDYAEISGFPDYKDKSLFSWSETTE